MSRSSFTRTAGVILAAVGAGALSGAGQAADASLSDEFHAPYRVDGTRARVQAYVKEGRIKRLYGDAFATGGTAAASVDAFLDANARALGVERDELVREARNADGGNAQGVMYDRASGTYKFTAVSYTQARDGVPVFGSRMVLLVRNEAGYPLVLVNPDVRDLGDFRVAAGARAGELPAPTAAMLRQRVQVVSPVAGEPAIESSRTVIFAGFGDDVSAPRLADETTVRLGADLWRFVTDAATGAVLHETSLVCHADFEGTVNAQVTQGPGSEQCEPEVITPMPYLRVTADGAEGFTDVNGFYEINGFFGGTVSLSAGVSGEWFDVFNFQGAEINETTTASPPAVVNFGLNTFNTEEERAQVNGYYHANVIRDFVVAANPSYPTVGSGGFPVTVNRTDGFCPGNAWYDPGEVSINFCLANGSSPNTSWTSVIYHEYGHHLVQAGGSGQGQYGEGMGDVMSTIILDDNRLGLGFFGDCGSSLRNADNTIQYPCGGAIHTCGQLISGCVWDTRNQLVVSEPADYQDILFSLAVNAILLHNGDTIDPSITIDWLTLDDDDSNIFNGTPHYNEIAAGFGAHNMDAPELALLDFQFPSGVPDLVSPFGTSNVQVLVGSIAGTPAAGTGVLFYDDGSGPVAIPMTENAPNDYTATFPVDDCGDAISFYFAADTTTGATQLWPPGAPDDRFTAIAGTSVIVAIDDDFETDQGWTVSGSVDDGPWERGVPAGGGDRGDPPADGDGSGQCYVTDNADGNSDVDGGTTILTSPALDASDPASFVSYHRWYSNTFGGEPEADTFVVEVSGNNGASWTTLETVGPGGPEVDGGWYEREFKISDYVAPSSQFRIRFQASDLAGGSVVEAAVDGVQVRVVECEAGPPCPGDIDGSGDVAFNDLLSLLASWGPCPACPEDIDASGTVDFTDLLTLLASWGPCP